MTFAPSRWIAAAVAILLTAAPAFGATLSPLASFAGDGWRAPSEVVTGDTAGTATGSNYNYLGTGSLERGLAYNPVTGNLVLVSRSTAGNGIRILDGTTGADVGALNQGSGVITGGTFTTNMVGVAEDGAIYVGNLQTNVSANPFKVYQWTDESAAAPTVFFGNTIAGYTGTPRHGDTLDVIGAGANTTVVAGTNGAVGYSIITPSGATAVTGIAGASAGDFRLGITFGPSANDVWGKQTGATAAAAPLRLTSYSGAAGTLVESATLTAGGEAPMDFAVIGGKPILAVADTNAQAAGLPTVRIYDMTTQATPVLIASGTTASGALATNGNGVGSVAFGEINGPNAILYAMVTNQGIQAFELTGVPEPTSAALFAVTALVFGCLRRGRQ